MSFRSDLTPFFCMFASGIHIARKTQGARAPYTFDNVKAIIMTTEQLSVFLENKSGRLNEVTGLPGKTGVNLPAMSTADSLTEMRLCSKRWPFAFQKVTSRLVKGRLSRCKRRPFTKEQVSLHDKDDYR